MDLRGSFPGVKQLGCEINHSVASGAEVKNEQSYTSTPSMPSWHGQGKLYHIFYSEKCSQNEKALILYLNVYMQHTLPVLVLPTFLTHCGRVTQICIFNTVKLGTSASSP